MSVTMQRAMQTISTLRPNVSENEALSALQSSGVPGAFSNLLFGPLRMMADAYVPFRLFRAEIHSGGACKTKLLAMDCVEGSLDWYGFDGPISTESLAQVQTRNFLPSVVNDRQATELVRAKLQRVIFQRGFFRASELRIEVMPAGIEFYVPYWLGFRGHAEHAQIVVLDAVRRRIEGSRSRALFRSWLSSDGELA